MCAERDLRVVIIGAGMAGILSSIRLLEAGYQNICIYEKADKVGGTWRWRTFKGYGLPQQKVQFSGLAARAGIWARTVCPQLGSWIVNAFSWKCSSPNWRHFN